MIGWNKVNKFCVVKITSLKYNDGVLKSTKTFLGGKKILKKIKKVKSVEKITVSNDFKLYWESEKLMKKDVTKKEAKKEIAHLKKLKKEET